MLQSNCFLCWNRKYLSLRNYYEASSFSNKCLEGPIISTESFDMYVSRNAITKPPLVAQL